MPAPPDLLPQATGSDASRCPLCGQANQCAIMAGLPAQDCWCMHTPVSRAALQRLAPAQRGQRCICPACARPLAPQAGPAPL
ncbi:cysteine-rich CWC family protein [Comamonas composti]|uniref:cysteine-rich CWC family protein n=1 Tax=Comamonas composti TaxID=408558 RepID=UPI00040629B8|nr:cysteine-rich CWC family protein [Comamonas composti]